MPHGDREMTRPGISLVTHGANGTVPEGFAVEPVEVPPAATFGELNAAATRATSDWILFLSDGAPWPGAALNRELSEEPPPGLGALELGPQPARGAGALLVRADAFFSAGGFFEDVRAGAARDLVLRLARLGWEVRLREGPVEARRGVREAFRDGAAWLWLSRRHGGPRVPAPANGAAARLGAFITSNRLGEDRPARGDGETVVVWTDAYPARSETFIYNEVAALRDLGWEVRVESAARPDRIEQGIRRRDSVRYLEDDTPLRGALALGRLAARHPVRCFNDFRDRRRWARAEDAWPLRALAPAALRLQRDGPAHVHVHFLAGAALSAMRICRIAGVPFTAIGHGYDVFERPANLQEKLRSAALAIAPCEYTARHLRTAMGTPDPRVEVVVMGIDANRFRRRRPAPGGRHVIAVGRLVPKKGFHHLVEAAAILSPTAPLDRVTIVGDGPLKDELGALIDALSLGETVRIVEAWGAEAVASLLEDADVLAMPALVAADGDRDAMPVVVKEAMAMELPVVGSDEVGLPELIEPGWGRLVPPGDPPALAGAIDEVLGLGVEARREMGVRARAHIVEFCSVADETRRLAELFREARDPARATRLRR